MGLWNVVLYETEDGVCEVADFLEGRKESAQAKALAWISQLEKRARNYRVPTQISCGMGFMSYGSKCPETKSGFFTFSFTKI